jgi:carbamoyltransferase
VGDTPTVIVINRTQDGSISVIKGSSIVYSLQKERITRRKHHWGRLGDLKNLYVGQVPYLDEPIDLVVECYSSDSEINTLEEYHQELKEVLTFCDEPQIVRVSHHLAHLYSAFYPSPFSQAAVMVIDCQGSPVKHFTEAWDGSAAANPNLLEVASFYRCERDHVECISKQLWDGDWGHPVGLGCFYYQLTRVIFPGEGNEGKVMGMAPFGQPDALGLPPLIVENEQVFIPDEWLKMFQERKRFKFSGGTGTFHQSVPVELRPVTFVANDILTWLIPEYFSFSQPGSLVDPVVGVLHLVANRDRVTVLITFATVTITHAGERVFWVVGYRGV